MKATLFSVGTRALHCLVALSMVLACLPASPARATAPLLPGSQPASATTEPRLQSFLPETSRLKTSRLPAPVPRSG